MMTFLSTAPLIAGLVFIVIGVVLALRSRQGASDWLAVAALSLAFFLYSAYTIAQEGPIGFWPEHTRNLWGVQIWFDLLLAAGVAWLFIVPRAGAVGMPLLPWFIVIPLSGSIGLLALVARLLWLERQKR